jgi:hypothetical protein
MRKNFNHWHVADYVLSFKNFIRRLINRGVLVRLLDALGLKYDGCLPGRTLFEVSVVPQVLAQKNKLKNSNQRSLMSIFIHTCVLCFALVSVFGTGCMRNKELPNPLGHDPTIPTPTPIPKAPGKSTVVIRTMQGATRLAGLNCTVQFNGGSVATGVTNANGEATFVIDAEGNYTGKILEQGDILESSLIGYCGRGQSNIMQFQAGGKMNVSPTDVLYDKVTGGTYPFNINYSREAATLKTRLTLSVVNFPSTWNANFDQTQLTDGQAAILNVTIPANSTDNANNVIVRGSAVQNAIKVDSSAVKIHTDWAVLNATLTHQGVGINGIVVDLYDNLNQKYSQTTLATGAVSFDVKNTGNYRLEFQSMGNGIKLTSRTGTIAAGEVKNLTFNGQPGSIQVSGGNYSYPYPASQQMATVTYVPAGDINYVLGLSGLNFVSGSVTASFGGAISSQMPSQTLTINVAKGATWGSSSLKVRASKSSTPAISIDSPAFGVSRGWDYSVSYSPNPITYSWPVWSDQYEEWRITFNVGGPQIPNYEPCELNIVDGRGVTLGPWYTATGVATEATFTLHNEFLKPLTVKTKLQGIEKSMNLNIK